MSVDQHPTSSASCPVCGTKGRKVSPSTPQHLLIAAKAQQVSDHATLRFCKQPSCPVVYFDREEARFDTADLAVSVFQKSTDPNRLVCYCFTHTVKSLQDEVDETGDSPVPEDIAAQCKAGLDRCHETNPQGSCCLGNVRKVIDEAKGHRRPSAPGRSTTPSDKGDRTERRCDSSGCCAAKPREATEEETSAGADTSTVARKAGLWSIGGAVLAAILSSACCWLPLALLGLGVSAAGVAGFFEAYRGLFLGLTAVLLGAGFYLAYVRKPTCAPGSACATPNRKLQRFNRVTLWVATVFVVAFAAFPNYVGALLGADDSPAPSAAMAQPSPGLTRTYAVAGMTCKGCSVTLQKALKALPGVTRAAVIYDRKEARVTFAQGVTPDDAAVLQLARENGYSATPTAQ